MNLKYFLIVSLIAFCAQGRTIDENKRFLGSIGNIINQIVKPIENLVKPITGIVNPIVDALKPIIDINNVVIKPITDIAGNVITQIVDPLKQVVNAITNQVIDPIKHIVAIVTNPIAIITGGGSGNNQGPNSVDYCNTVCYSRVNFQDVVTDFYFDRSNGCKSKGLMSDEIKKFDTCCDKHNQCLNSKCCTGDCQGLKDSCDDEYADCMDDRCQQIFNVNKNRQERSECLQVSEALRSASSAQKCTTQTVNRKICFC